LEIFFSDSAPRHLAVWGGFNYPLPGYVLLVGVETGEGADLAFGLWKMSLRAWRPTKSHLALQYTSNVSNPSTLRISKVNVGGWTTPYCS